MRITFSLKFFLLIATAVTVFLGYSQIRRQEILKVCDGLRKDGYVFHTPSEFLDEIVWQRKPVVGNVISPSAPHPLVTENEILVVRNTSVGKGLWMDLSRDDDDIAKLKSLGVVQYGTDGMTTSEISRVRATGIVQ